MDFTARNVTKNLVTGAIAAVVEKYTKKALTDYTSLGNDNLVVTLGSGVVAWGISAKLSPHSDRLVDRTADLIVAKREAKKAQPHRPTE